MTDKLIKSLSKKLDDLMPFDKWIKGIAGKIAEGADGWFFTKVLETLNTQVIEKQDAQLQADIEEIFQAFVSGDVSGLEDNALERLKAIDIPGLTAAAESKLFTGIVGAIFQTIEDNLKAKFETKDGDPGEGPKDPDPDK